MSFNHWYPSQSNSNPVSRAMRSSRGAHLSQSSGAFSSPDSTLPMGLNYPLEYHQTTTRRYTTADGRHVEETVSIVERVPTPDFAVGPWDDPMQRHSHGVGPYNTPVFRREFGLHASALEPASGHSSHLPSQSLSPDALLLQPFIPRISQASHHAAEPASLDVPPTASAWPSQLSDTSAAFSRSIGEPHADGTSWGLSSESYHPAAHGEAYSGSFPRDARGDGVREDALVVATSQEQPTYTERPAQYAWADHQARNLASQHQPDSSGPSPCHYPQPPPLSHPWAPHDHRLDQQPLYDVSHAADVPMVPQFQPQYPAQVKVEQDDCHALPTFETPHWIHSYNAVSSAGSEEKIDDHEGYNRDDCAANSGDESTSDGGDEATDPGDTPGRYTSGIPSNTISERQDAWACHGGNEKSVSYHGDSSPAISGTPSAACQHGVLHGVYCPDCRLYYELFGSSIPHP
ncbi:hypothetical protein AURDEDRAFT_126923 [Auricularia subglabra TFB-10046 SS5]|nr:hypothetical protein AURDEDRAFT_126923 [Auricularia subglabra TFB-10046 SS5]